VADHFAYWRKKWGWDMLNPDMEAIRTRWGNTEICWNLNPEMRQAGQLVIDRYTAATARAAGTEEEG
jgi:hypothetical protein